MSRQVEPVTIAFTPRQRAALKAWSAENERSVSYIVRKIVQKALDKRQASNALGTELEQFYQADHQFLK